MRRFCALILMLFLLCGLSACGRNDDEIYVVSREEGSGTRSAFVTLTGVALDGVDRTTPRAEVSSSTAVVMQTVAGNRGAIGYISLSALDDSVKAVRINGTAPTAENYPLARPFLVVLKENLSAAALDFLNFVRSDEGQQVVADNGCIPVDALGPFLSVQPRGRVVVEGSSSVAPVMEKLAEAYMAINPLVEIQLQADDSSTGIAAAASGLCDIGMASRALTENERAKGLHAAAVCMDAIAVIVHNERELDDLTLAQLAAIFRGEVRTWSEVGA